MENLLDVDLKTAVSLFTILSLIVTIIYTILSNIRNSKVLADQKAEAIKNKSENDKKIAEQNARIDEQEKQWMKDKDTKDILQDEQIKKINQRVTDMEETVKSVVHTQNNIKQTLDSIESVLKSFTSLNDIPLKMQFLEKEVKTEISNLSVLFETKLNSLAVQQPVKREYKRKGL